MTDRSLATLFDEPMGDWAGEVGERVTELPEVAAGFVEGQHPRDREGKFARKAERAIKVKGALSGAKALDSAPVRLTPDPDGHSGRYGNAQVSGLDDDDAALALSEMEGVEYASTNTYLRNKGTRPKYLQSPAEIERWERLQREGDPDKDTRIAGLDRAMDASPLPEDVVVHRGIKNGADTFGETWYGDFLQGTDAEIDAKWPRWEAGERPDMTGMVWEEKAYTHTTVKEERLKGYARKVAGQDPVAMKILVPQGVKAVQMSGMDLEGELMLERGLRFRVVTDHGTDADGVRQWDVEVIPHG